MLGYRRTSAKGGWVVFMV
uniref:Uncharacterized protein n=1 Tax=Anguilla anguilla TaxID=7936 RepID=A0A0E9XJ66_ANGAN